MKLHNLYCEKSDRRTNNIPVINNRRSEIERRSTNRVSINTDLYKDLKNVCSFCGTPDKSQILTGQDNKANKLSFKGKLVKLTQCILRDGSQSLRKPLSLPEKDELYKYLTRDGYQTLEIGFPTANDNEFEACRHLAKLSIDKKINPLETSVQVITRALQKDIEKTWESIEEGCKPIVGILCGMNDDQIKFVYNQNQNELRDMVINAIQFTKNLIKKTPDATIKVGFEHFFDVTPENIQFRLKMIEECVRAGADRILLANTVERTTPEHVAKIVKQVVQKIKSIDKKVIVGIHPHNDKGRAIDTALGSIRSGIDEVEVSTYGVGERQGGNLHAENFIRILEDDYKYKTGINRQTMYQAGERLREIMSKNEIPLKSPNETYSGIHVNGIKKVPYLYCPVDPALLRISGIKEEKIFTSQSGGTRLWQILEEYGYKMPENKDIAQKITSDVTNHVAKIENTGHTCPVDELVKFYENLVNKNYSYTT